MGQAQFQKRQREKARQEKQAEKRERKLRLASEVDDTVQAPAPPQDQVLAELAALHERFAAEELSFEDFEQAKDELMRGLRVE